MKKKLFLLPFYSLSLFGYNLETYIESWDYNNQPSQPITSCLTAVQNIPATVTDYQNIVFDLAFAQFNTTIGTGLQLSNGITIANIKNAIPSPGKLKLSFGGASGDYYFSELETSDYSTFAANLGDYLSQNNLDGVDFDIEGQPPTGTSQTQYAQNIYTFLLDVRDEVTGTISVTIPGQGWNAYWQYLVQQVLAYEKANNTTIVDYWNFMEYDIWVAPGLTFPQQIIADIQTYTGATNTNPGPNGAPGWGVPSEKIQLGLMIGVDDEGNTLSVQDVLGLIDNCVIKYNLYGVMTWDLDRDALNLGASPPLLSNLTPPITTPYSYFTNIYQALNAASDAEQNGEALPRKIKTSSRKPRRFNIEYPPFKRSTTQRQDCPPVLLNIEQPPAAGL